MSGVDRILGNMGVDCAKLMAIWDALRFAKSFVVSKVKE